MWLLIKVCKYSHTILIKNIKYIPTFYIIHCMDERSQKNNLRFFSRSKYFDYAYKSSINNRYVECQLVTVALVF
jgi:hypothetical protein